MLDVLSNFFISNLEDQVFLGTFGWWARNHEAFGGLLFFNKFVGLYGTEYSILNSNQPLIWITLSVGYYLFGFVRFYNLFVLFTFFLNFIFSLGVFKRLFKAKPVYLLLSFIFSFSPYIFLQAGRHLDLALVFLIPVYFYIAYKYLLESNDPKVFGKGMLYLALITIVQTSISNYYGFFMIMCTVLLLFTLTIKRALIERKWFWTKKRTLYATAYGATLALVLGISLWGYIKPNYLTPQAPTSLIKLDRTLDDFIFFSARPWYFVLPPLRNPFFGDFTNSVLDTLSARDYFLYDDYFYTEHGGNFLGYTALFFAALTLFLKRKLNAKTWWNAVTLLGLVFFLFLFTFPPFFTISGNVIKTPGNLLLKYFSMFRATNRLSIFMLFPLLLVAGFSMEEVFRRIKGKSLRYATFLFLAIFVFLEFNVPLKVIDLRVPPKVFEYIGARTPLDAKIAIYRSNYNDIFWLPVYKRHFVNPRGYIRKFYDADAFTEDLLTPEGLVEAKSLNVNYLVVKKGEAKEEIETFHESSLLNLVEEFPSAYLFKVL